MNIGKGMIHYAVMCNPIIKLIALFENCGFVLIQEELRDWHFNEFEVIMSGEKSQLPAKIEIEDIQIYNDNTYICKCHWSTIRLIFEEKEDAINSLNRITN